jgi:hypothetical protein
MSLSKKKLTRAHQRTGQAKSLRPQMKVTETKFYNWNVNNSMAAW